MLTAEIHEIDEEMLDMVKRDPHLESSQFPPWLQKEEEDFKRNLRNV